MGYAVFHRDGTGTPQVEDVDSLDAAVAIVERLRNEDAVDDVRVFREVPLEVRTYYKVLVADDGAPAVSSPDPLPVDAPAPAPVATVPSPPATDVADVPAPPVAAVVGEPAPSEHVAASNLADPLPGAFPLASATPLPAVEVHDAAELEDATEPARRHSLFGRGG